MPSQKQALIDAARKFEAACQEGTAANRVVEFRALFQAALALETPAAEWRVLGESDPHAGHYDGERAQLMMGSLSDDTLANEAFLYYDRVPDISQVIAGKAVMPIAYMTAVKERIRWLSRKVIALTAAFATPAARVVALGKQNAVISWTGETLPAGTLLYALPPTQEQLKKT